jgi:hypothetical protein
MGESVEIKVIEAVGIDVPKVQDRFCVVDPTTDRVAGLFVIRRLTVELAGSSPATKYWIVAV